MNFSKPIWKECCILISCLNRIFLLQTFARFSLLIQTKTFVKVFLSKSKQMNFEPKVFSKPFLEESRFICDVYADDIAKAIFSECSRPELIFLLKWLNNTPENSPTHLDTSLKNYFDDIAIPSWADTNRLQRATLFFSKHENIILYLLGVLALPYCYAAQKGVQVLSLSQRLQTDTLTRLKETALFVLNANSFAYIDKETWKNNILKIRLLHALVRILIRQSDRWQLEWGEPINQEDMAGTNLSFSYIVLRGMRKLGFAYTHREAEDFLHCWNVIGALMGIQDTLLPQTLQEAFWLDKQISEKEFKQCREGQTLCKALMDTFHSQSPSPFLSDFAIAQMRFLLGDKVADLLNIPSKNLSKAISIFTISETTIRWLIPANNFRKEIAKM